MSVDELLPSDQNRNVLASLRWTRLLINSQKTKLCEMKIAKAKKLKHEVPWHEPLLHIYQAAAAGQDGVSFAEEDMNPSDGAREDILGLINNIPLAPQEAKAKYYLATSSSDGIETNKHGLSKVCGMWICIVSIFTSHAFLVLDV